METVTVKQMIESLQRWPMDAKVEVAIEQYNQVYPVAYVPPIQSNGPGCKPGNYATMPDGNTVRITVMLPSDDEKFMYVGNRKRK